MVILTGDGLEVATCLGIFQSKDCLYERGLNKNGFEWKSSRLLYGYIPKYWIAKAQSSERDQ